MVEFMPRGLEVVGQLMVDLGGDSVRIDAQGDRIVVEVPDLRAGNSMARRYLKARKRSQVIGQLHDGLTRVGLTLQIQVGSRLVAVLGVGARSGRASRLFGFGPLEVRIGALLGALRRRAVRPERP